MILLKVEQDRLPPAERFGLDVLIDLSRLLVAERADCDLVRVTAVGSRIRRVRGGRSELAGRFGAV